MSAVSQVLNSAADLIEPAGRWTQNAWWRGKSGLPVKTRRLAVCFCIQGAVEYTALQRGSGKLSTEALAEVQDVVGVALADWNDDRERTQAEVVRVLRVAACGPLGAAA